MLNIEYENSAIRCMTNNHPQKFQLRGPMKPFRSQVITRRKVTWGPSIGPHDAERQPFRMAYDKSSSADMRVMHILFYADKIHGQFYFAPKRLRCKIKLALNFSYTLNFFTAKLFDTLILK